ncbi:MAG: AraC family transcriptional regulator [Treponema sp.]|jgi:AraC-like DNA-binding protein|nr:AraC family transcriptional regulator [Treponema sp.]
MHEINNLSEILPILTYYQKSLDYSGMELHFHNYHELILIREGLINFKIEGVDYVAGADSLVVMRAMEQHKASVKKFPYGRYVFTITNQLALMAIREPQLLSLLVRQPADKNHVIPLRREFAVKLAGFFERIITECKEKKPLWSSSAVVLITEALIELYREDPRLFSQSNDIGVMRTIINIQNYIAEHYHEKIVLDDLADRYFISKYYLSRKFKEITGYGFKNYLILYRIHEAQKLLQYTNKPVSEISSEMGYENADHFIRIFHGTQGISPLQYRKTHPPQWEEGQPHGD